MSETIDDVGMLTAVRVNRHAAGDTAHVGVIGVHAAVDDGDAHAAPGRHRRHQTGATPRVSVTVMMRSARRATASRCVMTIVVRPRITAR